VYGGGGKTFVMKQSQYGGEKIGWRGFVPGQWLKTAHQGAVRKNEASNWGGAAKNGWLRRATRRQAGGGGGNAFKREQN